MTTQALSQGTRHKRVQGVAAVALVTAAALGSFAQPSKAAGIDDVTTMVTALGGIAAAAVTVVLVAMGARIAIKLVNRVAVKG